MFAGQFLCFVYHSLEQHSWGMVNGLFAAHLAIKFDFVHPYVTLNVDVGLVTQ